MAKKLKQITDGEIRMTGTIKINNVDAINRVRLKEAIIEMKDAERGSWMLVRAYDKPSDYDKKRRKRAQQGLPYEHPEECVAEQAGYIVFKDSNQRFSRHPSTAVDEWHGYSHD